VRPQFRPTGAHGGARGGPAVEAIAALLSSDGAGCRFTAEGSVPADRSIAWAVLTDYNRFNEFLHGIGSSRVIRSQGCGRWVSSHGDVRVNR